MAMLIRDGIQPIAVFVDYGQRAIEAEKKAFARLNRKFGIEKTYIFNIPSFGEIIRSGLTDQNQDIVQNAFTPNRNLLFLILASSVAYQHGVSDIVIGLLSSETAIFPDQTDEFLASATRALEDSLGVQISIRTPLRSLTKANVVALAKQLGVSQTYSCHAGGVVPCGMCIACMEFQGSE
jgi:7-cyano-7-deazaguanine synthase